MVKLFTSKPKVLSSNLLRTKIKFVPLVFFTFLSNFNIFKNQSKLLILRWFFLHTSHLIYLFYDYVKKIQKYFLLIIFLLSQKIKHSKYFLILFKDVFFQTFKTQIFSKLLVNILHFSKSFSKHFNKLTHLFPWSPRFKDKPNQVSPWIS